GSAKHKRVTKVSEALKIAKRLRPDLEMDGELQFDAAVDAAIGVSKAGNSAVAGKANVLIFPDLDSGNIGYKIAQQLGGYTALGPLLQGLKSPMHDLSRGSSADDILLVSAIAALQSAKNSETIKEIHANI
ncbi:MAG: phosphate acetyltransferase, partial [Candidatus Marinimicrobia bacterium]|nr:phosphate acetyltransferase [Candidatus Neomarinimicrobiota bacterium]